MTNEEAIMILKAMIDEMILVFDRDRKKALNMAIEALKEQPEHSQNTPQKQPDPNTLGIKTDETCADAISRQAAIDVLESAQYSVDFCKEHGIDRSINMEMVRIRLNSLPSAQPERKTGKWIYNSPVTMKCNQCGLVIKDWDWHRFKFCPNCDCDMRGEQE